MTDTEVATVLPRELRLGAPPTMPQARSYLFRQQSTLQSYGDGQQIQINIPRLQRSYLRKDSYLRFALNVEETLKGTNNLDTKLVLDSAGAFGLIEKIEVLDYLGSTVLESISGLPQLMALLIDMGIPEVKCESNGDCSMGLSGGHTASSDVPFAYNFANDTYDVKSFKIEGGMYNRLPWHGKQADAYSNADVATADSKRNYNYEFALPLPSFLGFLSKKMVPLHNGFTILITLTSKVENAFFVSKSVDSHVAASSNINGAATIGSVTTGIHPLLTDVADTKTGYKEPKPFENTYTMNLTDVYMECQILELGPVAESMLLSSTQGQPLIVHTKSFRNYVTSVGPKVQEFNVNLNLNVASLTNVLWFMRSQDQLTNINHCSIGNRTRNMLWRWFFQYGSTTLPQNNGVTAMGSAYPSAANTDAKRYLVAENKATESFNELMKSRPVVVERCRIARENYCWDKKFGKAVVPTTGTAASDALSAILNSSQLTYPYQGMTFPTGKFACGLNLELATGKQGDLICGLNTNGMNTSIRGVFHPLFTDYMDPGSVRVDAYAEYDAFVNISPGIATTVSF
jgi:hypothetical protein